MRTWRVGTFSMGASMIFVGITLLISIWRGLSAFDTLIAWWPIVFVLLGCEILLYLWGSQKEQKLIHYDLASLFVVGCIGVLAIGFSLVTSTGVLAEIRHQVGSIEKTEELPPLRQPIPLEVKKIVVQTSDRNLKVDRTPDRELNLFGNYRSVTYKDGGSPKPGPGDTASVRTIGDTMYVSIKDLPRDRGLRDYSPSASISLVLPQDMPVELRGMDNRPVEPAPAVVRPD
jgi:hypothetical protein